MKYNGCEPGGEGSEPMTSQMPKHRDVASECLRFLREVDTLRENVGTLLAPLDLTLRDYEIMRCVVNRPLSQVAIVRQLGTNKVSVCRCQSRKPASRNRRPLS